MFQRIATIIGLVLLMGAVVAPTGVFAQSASNTPWSTSITYYTPYYDPNAFPDATLQIAFYAEGSSTPIYADPIALAPNKAGSLYIGNVSGMGSSFSGGAVLESSVPVIATAVNLAGSDYPRPLYSGFDPSQASDDFFIPTVLYQKFGQSSLVGIQNVEATAITATLQVYAVGASAPAFEHTYTIPGQSSKLIAAADMGQAPGFSGSARVVAGGNVVAAVQETDDAGRGAKAFEGVASDAGASTLYMASMMCHAYGGQVSYYAIQNVGTDQAMVEIDFYDVAGNLVHTATGLEIGVGNKISVNPCMYTDLVPSMEGIAGSAVIRSTNGQPLVAIGKISGGGMTPTAFLGQASGANKVAGAYIRWKADRTQGERSYIAVMNVGDVDAIDVVARYYDSQGNLVAEHTLADVSTPLPPAIKVNTNPSDAGALDANGDFGVNPYGGAVEIESDQPVVVVVRVSRAVSYDSVTKFAEDYNAVPVP